MTEILQNQALLFLRQALNNPTANFRDGQWEAIADLIQNRSQLLVVQRTGWGKSLVYFLATRLLRNQKSGPTLLISPLLALMRNQMVAAERIGVKAATINSDNQEQWDSIQKQLLAGQIDLLLISPERLGNEDFRNNILIPISQKIGLFVVDEAHCISDWGHDFRPDYRRIVRILQALPKTIPVLATTATANNRVVEDIKTQLGDNLHIVRGALTRNSLKLQNIHLPNPASRLAWLAETLPNLPGSGIIYTLTVKDAERVAEWLQTQGIDGKAYHGQSESREPLENQLLNNEIKVLVATTALGMGFDKPDLGFVIHYQRPGSVVHYYQQVGRAGRAVEQAYGILLCGDEDDDIINYFIQTAFPPEAHTQSILNALNQSQNGFSTPELEKYCNLSRGQIDKVLKLLSLEFPSPVVKQKTKWYATSIDYQPNSQKIEILTQIRRQEQAQMQDYMNSQSCLMEFLSTALDDPYAQPCGKCAVCLGQQLFPETAALEIVNQAIQYLKRCDLIIEPRKQWPSKGALQIYDFSGNIKPDLKSEIGRALCLWGDAGWGELVKTGKYQNRYFDDVLLQGVIEMIQRWQPQPKPTWVTCVPSLNRSQLVPDFAERLAQKLGLPFFPVVQKIRQTQPQKTMSNSYQQAHNLDGAFQIDLENIQKGAVFLVDDFVDSRWTLTIVTALLRQGGSGQVFPLALALNSLSQSS
ncbi:MAG: ATP-dependent DNA helicase RecG [Oscillatoriales cyanobacterium CG2_30_40_61]|nr:MAG: ATP-dependent DNA helicase RecG [Oscillatoriales cyanobacterium CG2_30_40_61]